MRLVFGLVLLVGLGLAGTAVYMAKGYIQQTRAQLAYERSQRAPQIETVDVYVAERALAYGDAVTADDVRLVAFPENSLPEGVFTAEEELFPKGADAPRAALRNMEKNEAVLAVKVTGPGEQAGISARLERGMRAFTVKVDATSAVSGFLRPGNQVDVYWTGTLGNDDLRTEGNSSGEVTKLIENRVEVIAVDQKAGGDFSEAVVPRTVTVAARPQQVAALAQAQSTGRLSLSLVGADDDTVANTIEIDQRRLLGITEQEQVVEKQPKEKEEVCTIRTRRGAEVVISRIPCTN
jgi:pilus assembly protein CpaB